VTRSLHDVLRTTVILAGVFPSGLADAKDADVIIPHLRCHLHCLFRFEHGAHIPCSGDVGAPGGNDGLHSLVASSVWLLLPGFIASPDEIHPLPEPIGQLKYLLAFL